MTKHHIMVVDVDTIIMLRLFITVMEAVAVGTDAMEEVALDLMITDSNGKIIIEVRGLQENTTPI